MAALLDSSFTSKVRYLEDSTLVKIQFLPWLERHRLGEAVQGLRLEGQGQSEPQGTSTVSA